MDKKWKIVFSIKTISKVAILSVTDSIGFLRVQFRVHSVYILLDAINPKMLQCVAFFSVSTKKTKISKKIIIKNSFFWSPCCHCTIYYCVWFAHTQWYSSSTQWNVLKWSNFFRHVYLDFTQFCFVFHWIFLTIDVSFSNLLSSVTRVRLNEIYLNGVKHE